MSASTSPPPVHSMSESIPEAVQPEWKHPVYGPTEKYTPGIAPIKPEYILPKPTPVRTGVAGGVDSNGASDCSDGTTKQEEGGEGAPKKLKGAARKRARREEAYAMVVAQRAEKKAKSSEGNGNGEVGGGKRGGQNKGRQFSSLKDGKGYCHGFLTRGEEGCKFGNTGGCRFSHDLVLYLRDKDRDIFLPKVSHEEAEELKRGEREREREREREVVDPVHASLDWTTSCAIFATKGFCTMGWKCRFLGSHVRRVGPSRLSDPINPTGYSGSGLELVRDETRIAAWKAKPRAFTLPGGDDMQDELNFGTSAGMKSLRIRKYPLRKTQAVLKYLATESQQLVESDRRGLTAGKGRIRPSVVADAVALEDSGNATRSGDVSGDGDELEEMENAMRNATSTSVRAAEAASRSTWIDMARMRPCEKRRLNWKGELYLAPLTTTGNLPFRRICTWFGSDIHCGEMGLAESFLHGNSAEWSLVRRHASERMFGTQLCGGKPDLLVPVAEALKNEIGDGLDFVDINCGCPMDLVYNKGGGSALLDHPSKLGKIIRGMNAVLGDTPLTMKLRTGTGAKQTTHKLFCKLQTEWGASAATVHGRSRKQRYKNDADWAYIGMCANTLRESVVEWNEESRYADEAEMVPIPVYGNGDVYSWQDYYERLERTSVDGEMIGRGALIKPWLFTEIKERRDWDISSRERLDMMRDFAEYGLSHWGSDTHGVNTTRRFMCEMMSFTHRYVPTGLLELVPSRLNDRPPQFRGRDDLETLLASSKADDWVKVSEMFLGRAPEEWSFTPKHKSSSYAEVDACEQQG